MQRFDFTKTGGFPLSQDRLEWLQDSYISAFDALGSLCGSTVPVVVSGVEVPPGVWSTGDVTDGWVWHPTLGLMPFVGSWTRSWWGVIYEDLKTPLVFKNGASQLVQIKRCARVSEGPVPAGVQTISDLSKNRWWKAFGKQGRDQEWQSWEGGFFGSSAELKWKKDSIGNLLKLRGSVTAKANISTPYTFGVFTLPAGYRPAAIADIMGVVRYSSNAYPTNLVTGQRIKHMNARLEPSGSVVFELEPCAVSYTAHFNCVINLD